MRRLGDTSLALWAAALSTLAETAEFAYDRDKVRVFSMGLLMIEVALATLATLLWYITKYHLRPQIESRAIREYLYRAGCRDTAARLLDAPGPYLVRPATPPKEKQSPEYYIATPELDTRADDYVS